ncbi:serine/threonine-protein kinase [Georgenia sp. H159]|uniref:serine/threonine-protein kinase n=1 Tax=Georgenia sp. H159 TaxID=3076115 RepID=UPI002D786402|nr:serine/threonine-protein kinase [Georgenia sp. H159]
MTRLADRYELRRVLGRGGMGEVWAARDVREGRDVAVKTASGSAALDRLRREATVAASVDHPGVVGVHGTGRDGATSYLVMDLLPGPDLGRVLGGGPLPAGEAVRVTAAVADALAATHRAGVIHGDVKPANVVVVGDHVVLIDFGVAATAADDDGQVTFGTAPFMAPEQVVSGPLTPATDVYALGCLLTAAVTGRPPFVGELPTAVLHRHVRATPPRLADLVPGVPAELDELTARMLAKDPARRSGLDEVGDVLARVRRDAPLDRLRPRPLPAVVGSLEPDATQPALVMLEEGHRAA